MAYLCCIEPFRKTLDGSGVSTLFLGNNRWHLLVCAKIISSLVRKALGIAKAGMSLGTLQGAVVSAAFVAGVSLVSILQAGNWTRVSIADTHYFSAYITVMYWHQDSVQQAYLDLIE